MAKTNVWVKHVECVERSTMRLQNEDLAQELLSACNSKMKFHQLAGQNLAKKSNSFTVQFYHQQFGKLFAVMLLILMFFFELDFIAIDSRV